MYLHLYLLITDLIEKDSLAIVGSNLTLQFTMLAWRAVLALEEPVTESRRLQTVKRQQDNLVLEIPLSLMMRNLGHLMTLLIATMRADV